MPSGRVMLISGVVLAFLVSGAIVAYFMTRTPERDPYATLANIPLASPSHGPQAPTPPAPLHTTPDESAAHIASATAVPPGVPNPTPLISAQAAPQTPTNIPPAVQFKAGPEDNDAIIAARFAEPDFAYARLPSDAPTAEFPLLLVSQRDRDLNKIQDLTMDGSLSPSELDMIDHARAGFFGTPTSSRPAAAPGRPGGPGGPTPPIPTPVESPSGL